jgi:hypothetical protein
MLARREVAVRSGRSLRSLTALLDSVAVIALRPSVLLVKCMLQAAAPDVTLDGLCSVSSDSTSPKVFCQID